MRKERRGAHPLGTLAICFRETVSLLAPAVTCWSAARVPGASTNRTMTAIATLRRIRAYRLMPRGVPGGRRPSARSGEPRQLIRKPGTLGAVHGGVCLAD